MNQTVIAIGLVLFVILLIGIPVAMLWWLWKVRKLRKKIENQIIKEDKNGIKTNTEKRRRIFRSKPKDNTTTTEPTLEEPVDNVESREPIEEYRDLSIPSTEYLGRDKREHKEFTDRRNDEEDWENFS